MTEVGVRARISTPIESSTRGRDSAASSVAWTTRCLDVIEQSDSRVHAVLTLNPRALDEAAAADRRERAGATVSPLNGVPILVKDNIDTADLGCSAGSRVLAEAGPPAHDAPIVRRIRSLGAVLLGKTNLSEWGTFRSARAVEGWSGLGGQTVNPHGMNRSPGGSSSGSAAAVAAGMAALAIGTETDGSVITPAGLNGVVGIKPEHGLLPTEGVVPVAPAQDVVGAFANTVDDAALCVAELSGRSSLRLREPSDPRTLRIGVCDPHGLPDVALREAAAAMRGDGAQIVDVDFDLDPQLAADAMHAALGGFARALPAYLQSRCGAPGTFASLIARNRADPVELAMFGQEIFEFVATMDDGEIALAQDAAVRARNSARDYLDSVLRNHRLDALIAPANSPARPLSEPEPKVREYTFTTLPASAGYPNVALPVSAVDGLPVGVAVFGPSTLGALLPIAAAVERATRAQPRCRVTGGAPAPLSRTG